MNPSSDLEQPRGAVEELASDPGSRKKFFKLMGGAGAATAFSLFVAACGGDG